MGLWERFNDVPGGSGLSYYLGPAAQPISALAKAIPSMLPGADTVDMQANSARLMDYQGPMETMGDAGWLGLSTLGMALPGRPGALREPAEQAAQGIRAYHGSPHDFDRFSMDKIGTGEGAQAYGHGLYFAESEGVAKSYKDALAPRANVSAGSALTRQSIRDIADELGMDRAPATAANVFERMSKSDSVDDYIAKLGEVNVDELRASFPQVATEVENEIRLVSELKARGLDIERPNKGHMYEVNINASPDDFLDWDKPNAAGQSEAVQAKLKAALPTLSENSSLFQPRTAEDAQRLREAGIPGIRYLDQGSRVSPLELQNAKSDMGLWDYQVKEKGYGGEWTPEGHEYIKRKAAELEAKAANQSRNYVVFDDNLVSILKKYGFSGLLAGTGLALGAQENQGGEY
jgi:hypothetical protein